MEIKGKGISQQSKDILEKEFVELCDSIEPETKKNKCIKTTKIEKTETGCPKMEGKIKEEQIRPIIVTDLSNLIETLGSPHPVQEKGLRVDIALVKQDKNGDKIAIRHVLGIRQVADVLTKKMANLELIRRVLNIGSLKEVLDWIEM